MRSFPGAAIIVLHSGIGNRALPYRSNTRAQVASNAFPLISIISSSDVFCNLKIVNTDNRSSRVAKKKSVVSFRHEKKIICSKTEAKQNKLDDIAHE